VLHIWKLNDLKIYLGSDWEWPDGVDILDMDVVCAVAAAVLALARWRTQDLSDDDENYCR